MNRGPGGLILLMAELDNEKFEDKSYQRRFAINNLRIGPKDGALLPDLRALTFLSLSWL